MGLYRLEIKTDGIYLSLTEDSLNNKKRTRILNLLKTELKLRNIKINEEELENWLNNNSHQPLKLSNKEGINLEGQFNISLSNDLLTAYLTIFPAIEGELKLSLAEIKTALINKGITYGIDEVKIMIALAENKFILDLPIAKVREPVPGKDAQIKYYFQEKGIEIKPKELENGKVDFYNINLIQIVKKGQLLIEKIPATKGISGMTVTGKEIPAPNGKNAILPIGKNLNVSDDNLKGYAACEGHVVIVDRRVSVLPVFEVNSDVDFSTGNIDFVGNVVVKGNVKDGFSVKADGDIEIYGTVEGGHISAGGNIFIKKGIRGLKKSKITAKGSIFSNFVEYANVNAGEDVIVNEAIMHSIVNSGFTVQVGGRKGLVVGGTCRAGKALICKNIGSNLATLTTIEVGIKPELRLEYKEVCQQITQTKESIEKTVKAVKLLNELKEKVKNLPPDKEALLTKLLATKNQLQKQVEDLFLHQQELEAQIKELAGGYVKVSGIINCGVNVSIGNAYKHFTNEMYKVILRQKGVDIGIAPLKE
jgi:hypothetical protein